MIIPNLFGDDYERDESPRNGSKRNGSSHNGNYKINPKSVTYCDTIFDSTLEARYAVLFDRLGFDWGYHKLSVASGKYNPTKPDFVVDRYSRYFGERRRKWRVVERDDFIVEIKPSFVTREILRDEIRNDRAPFQITALSQLAAEGKNVVVCTGAMFDVENKIESVDDLLTVIDKACVDLIDFGPSELFMDLGVTELLRAVVGARRFKFHLQTVCD